MGAVNRLRWPVVNVTDQWVEVLSMAGHLSTRGRVQFEELFREEFSDAQIAKRLGRDRSTVWRERKRAR